ncbi:MAG: 2-C-methyl-D-erythritol 2,4-cyclodiphosphate synthase [Firmicutes bacterium]|nr:2-C-methyl-D-erythritol 2,4-cyclodiphosphate synthase [Bacillota bacterium]
MYKGQKNAVIIAAAGSGKRLGGDIPKQYLKIAGVPVIVRTIRAFSENPHIDDIFIVANEDYISLCEELCTEYNLTKVAGIVAGGSERQDSVYRAITEICNRMPDTDSVLVHDAARPFVNQQTINGVIEAVSRKGAAIACVPVKDSIRKGTSEESFNIERKNLYNVQTPQGFDMQLLKEAYDRAFEDGYYGTDDASLVERLGRSVELVQGSYDNIKITTKEDMPMENRIGTGFDVHALVEGRKLIMGGVEIPFEKGLDGHSDADVLIHALMDAMLGAAALGDIGRHFPDTDPAYKGISSVELLKHVTKLIYDEGYSISNADITVMAQRPKIKPYIEEMRRILAETMDMDISRISIKGTTTERLGFVGREEGIAAQAVCLLCR